MAFAFHDDVLNAALNVIGGATTLRICSGTAPATTAAATTQTLASVTVAPADFTLADATGGGRRTTVAAKAGVAVAATGTPTHYVLVDGTRVLAVTEVDPATPGFTSGSTTDIPAVVFTVGDPIAA